MVEAFLAQHLGGRVEPVGQDFADSTIDFRAGRDLVKGTRLATMLHCWGARLQSRVFCSINEEDRATGVARPQRQSLTAGSTTRVKMPNGIVACSGPP